MNKSKKFTSVLKRYWWCHGLLAIVLILLYLVGTSFYVPVKIDSFLLFPNDTLTASYLEVSNHNSNLLSTLQVRKAWNTSSISNETDGILQTRAIYIAIVSIILTISIKQNKNRLTFYLIIILITMFYALDIHLKDLLDRNISNRGVTSAALNYLVNKAPSDTIWYELKYTERDIQYTSIHNNRLPRKIINGFTPDITQMILFILPWFAIYICITIVFPIRNEYKE